MIQLWMLPESFIQIKVIDGKLVWGVTDKVGADLKMCAVLECK